METKEKKDITKLPPWMIILILTGLTSCWMITGAPGLLAHPLRKIITWIIVGTGMLFAFPHLEKRVRTILPVSLALAGLLIFTFSFQYIIMLFLLAAVWGCLAPWLEGAYKNIARSTALAIGLFGFYSLARTCIPAVWMVMDGVAGVLGAAAAGLTGRPLRIGNSFAGCDFLLLMLLFYSFYLGMLKKEKRFSYAAWGYGAIIAGQLVYLVLLVFIPLFLDYYAVIKPGTPDAWSVLIEKTLPWNFPLVALVIHAIIVICICRWTIIAEPGKETEHKAFPFFRMIRSLDKKAAAGIALLLSVLLVLTITLYTGDYQLTKRKIVFYEKGFLNWLKPEYEEYGRYSIGMYGMLPLHLGALDSACVISPELSAEDLEGADLVVLIYPNDPWKEGQLERLWNYVRKGGTLLVFGEHTVEEKEGGMRFNDVLEPTGMRVLFDSATFQVGGWLQSYETLAGPVTLGFKDDENQFGIVIGASLSIKPPARPVIIGRWGWSDRGDLGKNSFMGDSRYNADERLGDLVLAAEQDFGRGRIFVFGDTSSISNGIVLGCHSFVYRLLGCLSAKHSSLAMPLRSLAGILLLGMLVIFLVVRKDVGTDDWSLAVCSLAAAVVFSITIMASYNAGRNIPGKTSLPDYKIAYIDAAHANAYSAESWRPDGTMGMALNLMRNKYLTLMLREFDREMVLNSDLLLVIAPLKRYTAGEIEVLDEFVRKGGRLICTVGYTEYGGSENLLTHFGFSISGQHDPPVPMGFFKGPYLNVQAENPYYAYVRFYAGWPVSCTDKNVKPLVYGNGSLPVAQELAYGKGTVTVIGDTGFALNKNLENEGGEPFEGMRENADFWRWYLGVLETGKTVWIPPAPPASGKAGEE